MESKNLRVNLARDEEGELLKHILLQRLGVLSVDMGVSSVKVTFDDRFTNWKNSRAHWRRTALARCIPFDDGTRPGRYYCTVSLSRR
jgi:hypothetical protein